MIAFAFIDASGVPTGGGMRRTLPEGAVELPEPYTTADLARLRFVGGGWTLRPSTPPPSATEIALRSESQLVAARVAGAAQVQRLAGDLRRVFFTDITGQDAIYLEKRSEAAAYVAEVDQVGAPATLEDYPLLAGEVGLTAPDAWQLAQVWLNRAELFKRIGAATEAHRLRALAAIQTASDYEAIDTIVTDFNQALSGLSI